MVWNIDPVLIELGPLQIRYYGLMFLATIVCGWWAWRWQMLRGGHSEEWGERHCLFQRRKPERQPNNNQKDSENPCDDNRQPVGHRQHRSRSDATQKIGVAA